MNILFICGSLASRRDGVADYTLRLAEALRRAGAQVRCLGWAEGDLQAPERGAYSLRLPTHLPYRAKLSLVAHYLQDYQPDLVSLQYVPYAYHPKGLPYELAAQLRPIIGHTPVHIFAHELWVMPCMRSSWPSRIIGATLQRTIVLQTLRALQPVAIHTSIPLYKDALWAAGLSQTHICPLFGGIPVHPISLARTPQARRIGFFGHIFPSAPLESFARQLVDLQQQAGLQVSLCAAGNLSAASVARWRGLVQRYPQLRFETFGHLPPRELSYYLQGLDFFASGYGPTFWGKSGTIAAAREHGLPTILISPPEVNRPEALPVGIYTQLTPSLLEKPPKVPSVTTPLDNAVRAILDLLDYHKPQPKQL